MQNYKRLRMVLIVAATFVVTQPLMAQDEQASVKEWNDRNSQLHTVIILDSLIGLSPEQYEKAMEVVQEQWLSKWNENMSGMSLRVIGRDRVELIENLDLDPLKPLLRKSQLAALDDIAELAAVDFVDVLVKGEKGELDETLERYRTILVRIVDLKIEEYQDLAAVNDDQAKRLRIARNGITSRARRNWLSSFQAYAEQPNEPDVQRAAMVYVRRHAIYQCIADPVWQRALEKILDKPQLEKIQGPRE